MRKAVVFLMLVVVVLPTASAKAYQMGEGDLYRPDIYGRYLRDIMAVTCHVCAGPTESMIDAFTRDTVECVVSRQDECFNTSHVKEYYCDGSSIRHVFTECTGDYACSEGVCMLLPDLTVSRIDINPPDVGLMDLVSLRIEVANTGFLDAPAVNLTVYWTCEPVTVEVEALPAGNSTVIQLDDVLIFTDAGVFDVVAWVDSDFILDEYREDNNNLTQTITVELPGIVEPEEPASDLGDEPMDPVSCTENDLMRIGRAKGSGGVYYRDAASELIRELAVGPWEAVPAKNRIPYADFEFVKDWYTGYFNFTDASIDHDGNITAWHWLFETDGHTATGRHVVYDLPSGEHMVWLTVTDDDGVNATVGRSVTVDTPQPNLPRADFTITFRRGTTVSHNDASVASPGANITEYSWDIPWMGSSSDEEVWYQYQRDGVVRITHTVTDSTGQSSTVVRDAQIESVWLPGQGSTNSCGTTSLAYILRYLTGSDTYTHFIVDDEVRASDPDHSFGIDGGMYADPTLLVEYAHSQGVNAEVYQNGDFSEIRRFIDDGVPVMLILSGDGSGDIFGAHYIVVVNYCSRPTGIPGEHETVYAIYNPWGYQYEIPEDRLARYWDWMRMGNSDIMLWNRLYIAVSNGYLPAGDLDGIKTELAFSRALSMMNNGADDFADGEVLEGLVEMVGGCALGIVSGLSDLLLGWAGHTDKVPLIGGVFGAADELVGGVVAGLTDFVDSLASDLQDIAMFWYDPLAALAAIGDLIVSVFELIADVIVAVFDFIVDIFVAIGEFLALVFEAIGEFFCWLFQLDCTRTVCVLERMVSIDACGETRSFTNHLERVGTLGYVSTVNDSGLRPLYKVMMTDMDSGVRDFKLVLDDGAESYNPEYVRVGRLGFVEDSCSGDCLNLTQQAADYNLSWGNILGYTGRYWTPDSEILWLFQDAETCNYTVDTDFCAKARTFVSNSMNGYTRGKVEGYIRLTKAPDTVRIYRYYDEDSRNFFLSTNANETDPDYVINGFLGYAYTSNIPGTVPLHSYSPKTYRKQNITIMCEDEERTFDTPIGYIYAEEHPCTTAVYKYCKRYIKEV
jgi:PKD repeat protein